MVVEIQRKERNMLPSASTWTELPWLKSLLPGNTPFQKVPAAAPVGVKWSAKCQVSTSPDSSNTNTPSVT